MAEKEERITIHEVAYPCKKCSINCNKNDWKDCDFYQNYISGMKRQEAIAEMAYAMLKADDTEASNEWLQLQWNSTRIRKHYMVMAEAALNALLEGK